MLLALVSACAIELPDPALAPDTFAEEDTVQEKVVPATRLESAILVDCPEQMACVAGVATAAGMGLTVMVTVIGVPAQPSAVGVMV